MRTNGSVTTSPRNSRDVVSPAQTTNLADLLERVLDKGIVIAGDITLFLGGVQLLTLRIRLLVASIDKAQEIGINWWQFDPALSVRASARAKELEQAEKDRNLLNERLDRLERLLPALPEARTAAEGGLRGVLQEADQKRSQAGQRSNAPAAYVLDPEGRMIAELKQLARQPQEGHQSQTQKRAPQPGQHLHEDEQPQAQERPPQPHEDAQPRAPERTPRPEAAQAEQPAGGGPRVGQDLHERISQAMRRVLEEVRPRNTQAPQPVAQAQPSGQRGEEQPLEEEQPQALERAAQPGAVQPPAPACVRGDESRMSGTPQDGRVTWHLAVADLDREDAVIAELEQPVQQAHEDEQPHVQEPEAEHNAAAAHVLDTDGSMIAELRRRAQQPPEEERPQAPERAERPRAAQTEQPAGGRALVGQALQEQIAQAIRPVLGVVLAVHVGIAQAPQEDELDVAPAAVLDPEGRVIAELKPLHEQE
jgi:Gas vesicle protein